VGLEGATLAIQADAGAVDGTLGEFTADQDGELVVGAGASEGLGGRLSARYSDEDHDLGREYGLEVGYGPGSASVAYEPRHRPPTGPRPPRLESGAPPAHRGQR
jgi:hypothetical protein